MRDRLIELIKQGDKTFADKYTGKVMSHIDEIYDFVADYLLSNGVIVPPCKVEDKVYVVDYTRLGDMIFECTVEEISHFTCRTYYHLDWGLHIPRFKACHENCFGKTVFLTREEAEKALVATGGKEKGR